MFRLTLAHGENNCDGVKRLMHGSKVIAGSDALPPGIIQMN
jgi:hypothetical protein